MSGLNSDNLQQPGVVVVEPGTSEAVIAPESVSSMAIARDDTASTILLVDDDSAVRRLVGWYLRRAGYEVVEADDGARVFEVLESADPDLFLLDCQMPEVDGFEVCRRLREDARYGECPVVFLTALSEARHVARGFEVGGVDYVRKPVIAQELLARIRTHLDIAIMRRAERRRATLLESLTAQQSQHLDDVRTGQELLLTRPTLFPELRLGVRHQAAHAAGGDFYEIARLSDNEFALFVADVSGHDLSIPFVTGALKALTASFLNPALTPQETMLQLNASLMRFLQEGRFISACYAQLSLDRMVVEIVNAGHPYPLLQRDGRAEYLALTGDVLGVFETAQFGVRRVEVRPGDRLFLFTDGLTEGVAEATGRRGRVIEGQRMLQEWLLADAGHDVADVVHRTIDRLAAEQDGVLQDDVVLLGIEF